MEMEMSNEEKAMQKTKIEIATMLRHQNETLIAQNQQIINLLIDLKHCTCIPKKENLGIDVVGVGC